MTLVKHAASTKAKEVEKFQEIKKQQSIIRKDAKYQITVVLRGTIAKIFYQCNLRTRSQQIVALSQ